MTSVTARALYMVSGWDRKWWRDESWGVTGRQTTKVQKWRAGVIALFQIRAVATCNRKVRSPTVDSRVWPTISDEDVAKLHYREKTGSASSEAGWPNAVRCFCDTTVTCVVCSAISLLHCDPYYMGGGAMDAAPHSALRRLWTHQSIRYNSFSGSMWSARARPVPIDDDRFRCRDTLVPCFNTRFSTVL